jgi:hypothetical protein
VFLQVARFENLKNIILYILISSFQVDTFKEEHLDHSVNNIGYYYIIVRFQTFFFIIIIVGVVILNER